MLLGVAGLAPLGMGIVTEWEGRLRGEGTLDGEGRVARD
jgi:hypothetical protein